MVELGSIWDRVGAGSRSAIMGSVWGRCGIGCKVGHRKMLHRSSPAPMESSELVVPGGGLCKLWECEPTSDKSGPHPAEIRPTLTTPRAEFERTPAEHGRSRSMVHSEFGPNWPNLAWKWPQPTKSGPNSDFEQTSTKLGLARFGPEVCTSAPVRPISPRFGTHFGWYLPQLGEAWPTSANILSKSAQTWL